MHFTTTYKQNGRKMKVLFNVVTSVLIWFM